MTGARRRAKHLIVELDSGDAAGLPAQDRGPAPARPARRGARRRRSCSCSTSTATGGCSCGTRRASRGLAAARRGGARGAALVARTGAAGGRVRAQEYLRERLASRRAQIKPLLLDQKVVSGIGNIYVDEILYDARLHPRRKANTLSREEWAALHAAILENLAAGVEHRGTTVRLYQDVLGRPGRAPELPAGLREARQAVPGGARERSSGRRSGEADALLPAVRVKMARRREQGLTLG